MRETAKARPTDGTDQAGAFLLVVGRDAYATYDLPATGALTIGRGETNTVRIDDPLASRTHACLHVGDAMYLEDVGSVNGTRVKDRVVKPGERVKITIGETIQIGSSVLIVQRRAAQADLIHPETLRDEGGYMTPPSTPRAGEAMRKVHELAERSAAGTINVLITGETGVGKELLAETVHRASPRRGGPYVCLNCAALSETLLESELFGHERGAFTGAVQAKPGLLETAAHGSLFLDEVGELPPALQAKLLRVIETREVLRVGGVRARKIDVRFVSATNRDLEAEVARGGFRRDLYFRLNGMTLTIPPLRERPRDLPILARAFVTSLARGRAPEISEAAMAVLRAHGWPGNVRELRNVIERALLLCDGRALLPEHLPPPVPVVADDAEPALPAAAPAARGADGDERTRILAALAACGGNQSRAARQLGISRKVLIARLDSYGVARPRKPGLR